MSLFPATPALISKFRVRLTSCIPSRSGERAPGCYPLRRRRRREEEKKKGARRRARRRRAICGRLPERRRASRAVPRACPESTKICSYEVQVQVQVVPRADLRHFKQLGTKPGGNGGGGRSHQLRNSAFVRDRDGGQGRERRAERRPAASQRSSRSPSPTGASRPAGPSCRLPCRRGGAATCTVALVGWLVGKRRETGSGCGGHRTTVACAPQSLNLALALHGGWRTDSWTGRHWQRPWPWQA